MKYAFLPSKKNTIIILLFIISSLISVSANASDTQKKIFKRYITTNAQYKEQIKSNSTKIAKLTFTECQNDIDYARLKPTILIEPVFSKRDEKKEDTDTNNPLHPSYGQWIERSIVTACNNKIIINHLVIAGHEKNSPTFFPMVNGRTKIDQIYQSRVLDMITEKLRQNDKKCHGKIFTMDTNVMGYRNPATNALSETDHNSGWFERWVIKACDQSYNINIAVLPDPRTTYRFIVRIAQ